MDYPDTATTPQRYEDFDREGAMFMMRVFDAGGCFKRHRSWSESIQPLPAVREVPRNAQCPCGSGAKTKKCHSSWCGSSPETPPLIVR